MTGHLELMSKQRLIAIIHGQENTIRALRDSLGAAQEREKALQTARRAATVAQTPQQVLDAAQALLQLIPADPEAAAHREALEHEVWASHAKVRRVPVGGRCGDPDCRRPLHDGRCHHHNRTRDEDAA